MSKNLDELTRQLKKLNKIAEQKTSKEIKHDKYLETYGDPIRFKGMRYDDRYFNDPYVEEMRNYREYMEDKPFDSFKLSKSLLYRMFGITKHYEGLAWGWIDMMPGMRTVFMPLYVGVASIVTAAGLTFIAPVEGVKATVHNISKHMRDKRDDRIFKARQKAKFLEREICEEVQNPTKDEDYEAQKASKAKAAKSPVLTQSKENLKEESETR